MRTQPPFHKTPWTHPTLTRLGVHAWQTVTGQAVPLPAGAGTSDGACAASCALGPVGQLRIDPPDQRNSQHGDGPWRSPTVAPCDPDGPDLLLDSAALFIRVLGLPALAAQGIGTLAASGQTGRICQLAHATGESRVGSQLCASAITSDTFCVTGSYQPSSGALKIEYVGSFGANAACLASALAQVASWARGSFPKDIQPM